MSLFVIPVPAPAIGHDWAYTVPGQYIEHITAVTATLTTAAGNPTVMIDGSGTGNNGTFDTQAGSVKTFGVAGIVGGDTAIRNADLTANAPIGTCPTAYDLNATGGWANVWTDTNPPDNIPRAIWTGYTNTPELVTFGVQQSSPGVLLMSLFWTTGSGANSVFVTGPLTAAPHMWSYDYDQTVPNVQFYLDGAPFGAAQPVVPPFPSGAFISADFGRRVTNTVTYDEVAFGDIPNGAAAYANIFAQASVSFAAYTAAVLNENPLNYYHLDETVIVSGRQVDLVVTDGTRIVLEVPTGFAEGATAGAYSYSWQPNLNSSTQLPSAITTTVAVPDLILPAGYTLGTNTLDLGSADQWSDIHIWWDDSFMQALNAIPDYVYPPGVRLVYQQVGA